MKILLILLESFNLIIKKSSHYFVRIKIFLFYVFFHFRRFFYLKLNKNFSNVIEIKKTIE